MWHLNNQLVGIVVVTFVVLAASASASSIEDQIAAILNVEKEGAGHAAAVPALAGLSQQSADALVPILHAMDHANPRAANWLQGAFEAIADRNMKVGKKLNRPELESFVLARSHSPQARRLAFDWVQKLDPTAADRLVPGMIDDPCPEFRRLAIERLLDAANKARDSKDADGSKQLYQQAFAAALDADQLDVACDELTKLGEKPDLKKQLGLLTAWALIGPFDHRKGIGFDAVYPPEREIDLNKSYAGKEGDVSWVKKETDDRHGVFDINKLFARHKGAVIYAYGEFNADHQQPVEIRLGTPNGWKLWVNDKPLFAHEEYHLMNRMDQYTVPVTFQVGTNRLLLKVCQNEQTEDWAQEWQFQLRVCDATGAGVSPRSTNE